MSVRHVLDMQRWQPTRSALATCNQLYHLNRLISLLQRCVGSILIFATSLTSVDEHWCAQLLSNRWCISKGHVQALNYLSDNKQRRNRKHSHDKGISLNLIDGFSQANCRWRLRDQERLPGGGRSQQYRCPVPPSHQNAWQPQRMLGLVGLCHCSIR